MGVTGYFGRDYSDGMSEEMRVSIKPMRKGGREGQKSMCREVEVMNQKKCAMRKREKSEKLGMTDR